MKVLVTGGAGFIGSHVVDALRERCDVVVCVDSLDPTIHRRIPDYLPSDIEYRFADLRYWEPDETVEDVEAIIHLAAMGGVGRAARDLATVIDANCQGTAKLIDHARRWNKLRQVVLISSFSVYGDNYSYRCPDCGTQSGAHRRRTDLDAGRFDVICSRCGAPACIIPITPTAVPSPLETYGASKYMQELCFRGFDRCPVRILRLSSVYGTRLRLEDGEATIIAKIVSWVSAGVPPQLFEDGCQIRDWVYVGDVVAAVLASLDAKASPPIINVCSGVPTTLREACEAVAEAMGVHSEPEIVGGYRPGDMRHCLGDPSGLKALIGRDPIPFREGAVLAFGRAKSREIQKRGTARAPLAPREAR